MYKIVRISAVFALGVFCGSLAPAQQSAGYIRVNCVKVRDGKGPEFSAYLRDFYGKLAKVRIDAGEQVAAGIAQAVAPAGRSARCDYHLVSFYAGFPAEPGNPEKLAADMKKAGITISREALIAKRDELSYLVATEVWRTAESVGRVQKGGYVRLNYYHVKPGMMAEYVKLESTGWKKLAAKLREDDPGRTWGLQTLVMPGGTGLPYNAMTVDGFPSWAALGQGMQTRAMWNKVHPEMDWADYIGRINAVADRPRVEVLRVVDMIAK